MRVKTQKRHTVELRQVIGMKKIRMMDRDMYEKAEGEKESKRECEREIYW